MNSELRKATAQIKQVRKPKVKLTKFFGKCEMPDGSENIIVAKAVSIDQVSKQLHKGYKITMVLDILTEVEMEREWAKIKPSNIKRPVLR